MNNKLDKFEAEMNVEIVPITGEFSIFFNGVIAGDAQLTEIGMKVWNRRQQCVFNKEEMRLNYRRQLLHEGVSALKSDYLNYFKRLDGPK